jgi:hypothetical protein
MMTGQDKEDIDRLCEDSDTSLLELPETTSPFSLKHTSRHVLSYGTNEVGNKTPSKTVKSQPRYQYHYAR